MGNIHICLVDDEPASHAFLKQLAVRHEGVSLTHFTCGADLIAEVKEEGCNYDCIVIDVKMPDLSGPDVFHRLVRLKCPAVMLYYSSTLNEYESRSCMISKTSQTPLEDMIKMYNEYNKDHLGNMFKMAIRTTELQKRVRCRR